MTSILCLNCLQARATVALRRLAISEVAVLRDLCKVLLANALGVIIQGVAVGAVGWPDLFQPELREVGLPSILSHFGLMGRGAIWLKGIVVPSSHSVHGFTMSHRTFTYSSALISSSLAKKLGWHHVPLVTDHAWGHHSGWNLEADQCWEKYVFSRGRQQLR